MDRRDLPPEVANQPFEIAVRRLADDLRYGLDISQYVGSGVDYVQSRPFVDGDPAKDIDWRVSARTGRFHVKQYESLKATTSLIEPLMIAVMGVVVGTIGLGLLLPIFSLSKQP